MSGLDAPQGNDEARHGEDERASSESESSSSDIALAAFTDGDIS